MHFYFEDKNTAIHLKTLIKPKNNFTTHGGAFLPVAKGDDVDLATWVDRMVNAMKSSVEPIPFNFTLYLIDDFSS
uniref:Tnp_DDE_dom domain-containing protein n=1 Tax=Steinernema glaseri TaxID=37863 RepID=A0A1I7Z8S1_9BILA